MADKDDKIDEMHGMLHAMKPMLEDVRADQKAMDVRVRASELTAAEHGVKIERLKEDVDGLGRKVRNAEIRAQTGAPGAAADTPGKWAAFADFFGALPSYWHVIVSTAVFVAGLVTMIRGRMP